MKKVLAMIMATSMLTTMAVAADYTPGQEIKFDGTEESIWDGEVGNINSENYSLSTIRWNEGKDMIASVTIDDDDEVLVVELKHDYKSTKEKQLDGTIKLREKGESNYVTVTVKGSVGYNVVELDIDEDHEIKVPTIDSGSIYKINGNNKGYGTLLFTAGDADISVRVYDGEVYYLAHTNTPNKNVLVANADSDAVIDFMNFEGTPTFNSTATISFYGVDEDSFIYEIKDGKLVKSAAEWSEDNAVWELKTRTLGSYVISDKALKSPSGSTSSEGNSGSGSNGSVENPDTGANDVVGLAAALAAAALVSAAAVSMKKK
jgi:hypothetical protein